MHVALALSTLALRKLVDGACTAVGIKEGGDVAVAVGAFLNERFTDHSQRLTAALQVANERAWRALELALAGESFWERCKVSMARTEDRAFAQQVRAFLDATLLPEPSGKPEFRRQCLDELRAARKAGLLATGTLPPRQLAEQTVAFVRFSDPQHLLDGEWRLVAGMAQQVKEAGFPNLAWLLAQRPPQDTSVLVAGVRYFFRRAVEEDQKLFQGLAFSRLERLGKQQEEGFAALAAVMAQQGQRLTELLADVQAVVVETHSAVLNLRDQIEGQSGHLRQIGEAVQKLLEQHNLQRREVRPGDSLSIRNDNERQLVKQLVARYRALPEGDRRQVPALLNAVGKLEVVAGDFDAAREDFAAVATMVEDNKAQAEAHFNAYQACLERHDWPAAIGEFIQAVKLDARRFASFPVGKYQPQRILGAGGFGVAFLCKHKYMDAQVVVKTLMLEDLGRDADKVFTEAQVLRQLDHPAIIRISDCGYVDSATRSRPFLVMDYFQGGTLEEYVKMHGPLAVDDLLDVARRVAEGLQAAHGKGILHRDVKPANLLVRKEGAGWQVKVIDFGLALRQKVLKSTMNASTARRTKTLVGDSIAGTLDYAAPEQMGKRNDAAGPYSDVYGWAKTCCLALFQTTQPLFTHWQSIPLPLAQLLERCLSEDPAKRPQSFAAVLDSLSAVSAPPGREDRQPAAAPSFEFEEPAAETVKRQSPRARRGKRGRSKLPLLIGGGAALLILALVLLFTVVLRPKPKTGTPVETGDQPGSVARKDNKPTRPLDKPRSADDIELARPPDRPKEPTGNTEIKAIPSAKERPREPVGEVRVFEGHHGGIWAVAVSPDGRYGLSGSGTCPRTKATTDFTMRLWELTTGKEVHCFRGHDSTVKDVAFSPDGKRALSGSWDKTVRLWDVASGKEVRRFEGHTAEITGVAFFPDGKRIASCGVDRTVRIWDVETGKEVKRIEGRQAGFNSFALLPDGRRTLCGGGGVGKDNAVRLWHLATGEELRRFEGHDDMAHSIAVSPEGRRAVSGSANCKAIVWDIATGREIRRFPGHCACFSHDGRRLLEGSGNKDHKVRLYDTVDWKCLQAFTGHTDYVQGVAITPDGRYGLSGSWDGTLRLWRLPPVTGTQTESKPRDPVGEIRRFEGHTGQVWAVAVSPDGRQALSGNADNLQGERWVKPSDFTVWLWDVKSGKQIRPFVGHSSTIRDVAFSSDGHRAATCSLDKTVRIWDVATGRQLHCLPKHTDGVVSIAFSPDGKYLLSGSGDKTMRLWDVASGKQLHVFHEPMGGVGRVAFLPDGLRFLAATNDSDLCGKWVPPSENVLRLWDVKS